MRWGFTAFFFAKIGSFLHEIAEHPYIYNLKPPSFQMQLRNGQAPKREINQPHRRAFALPTVHKLDNKYDSR
jgi:hypothetical protein